MRKLFAVMAVATFLAGCHSVPEHTAIFSLEDFGPEASPEALAGFKASQPDNSQSDATGTTSKPKVVVYRDIPAEKAMELYSEPPWNKKEYIFISYKGARDFLSIQSSYLDAYAPGSKEERLLKKYRRTRSRMIRILGR